MEIKKNLTLIWNEFIYGGHLLSLGAVSIVYTASILLNIKITWDFLVIVYLGSYAPYIYNRYKELKKDFLTNPIRTRHIEKYFRHTPIIISFSLLIIIGIFLYFNKISALLFAIFLILLSFSYSIFFKGLSKKIIGFKNFYISLGWALLVVLLAIYYSSPIALSLFLIALFVYLRLFVNTIFFDIKDIEIDKEEKLLTLPVVLGQKRLIQFLSLINILAVLPVIIGVVYRFFPFYSLILLFTIPYSGYYLNKAGKETSGFLYYVIVDGEYILWPIFILLGKTLFLL